MFFMSNSYIIDEFLECALKNLSNGHIRCLQTVYGNGCCVIISCTEKAYDS